MENLSIKSEDDKITFGSRAPIGLIRRIRIIAAQTGKSLEDCYTEALSNWADEQEAGE